ncbi:E3 ubiquitin-protein ligase rnf213-alpha-like [Mytilus trossulus]|uniref:E3 ubiquitin-protein ligase rnf213-alpha-like n=1 Tax=Mytilus trossulus TaxID=6551 RepID=UPI003007DF3E
MDSDFEETITEVLKFCEGVVFLKIWDTHGDLFVKQNHGPLCIDDIIRCVYFPAREDWSNLQCNLKLGTISFEKVEDIFGYSDILTVKANLQPFASNEDLSWIDERIDQLEQYRSIKICKKGASIVKEIANAYNLQGNFEIVEVILNLNAKSSMDNLSASHFNACDILRNWNDKQYLCLREFLQNKPLVTWLRTRMGGSLKQLKTFVDLAYIASGDDPMDISKVTCLHSAAVGYEDLIFKLNKNCSFLNFIELCHEVWRSLDNNPYLALQLTDTGRYLEWFKQVDELRGSIEMTSLAQAKAINTNGIYIVGAVIDSSEQRQLDDVLTIKFIDDQGVLEKRHFYSYKHLHDLQSRLMLVVADTNRNKQDTERFLEILDAVVLLGNIYIGMVSSGCVLFSQFKVEFRCNKTESVAVLMSFGSTEDRQIVRCKRQEEGMNDQEKCKKDIDILRTIAKCLEEFHTDWLTYIRKERENKNILNMFTTSQLVILQRELAKLRTGSDPNEAVYPLLFCLKENCCKSDLSNAIDLAMKTSDLQPESISNNTSSSKMENAFIEEMMGANFSKYLAKKALEVVKPDQIDEGIDWCLAHESKHLDTKEDEFLWCQTEDSLEQIKNTLFRNITKSQHFLAKVIQELKELWTAFKESRLSSLSNFLSLRHTAIVLEKLEKTEITAVRTFAATGFEEGSPNLLICPQDEILQTVLSIYCADGLSSLPKAEEILLCSENTSLEMIDEIQSMTSYTAHSAEKEEYKINNEKTKVMIRNSSLYCKLWNQMEKFHIGSEELETVESYKHIGVDRDSREVEATRTII